MKPAAFVSNDNCRQFTEASPVVKFYLRIVAALLLATATIKFFSVFSNDRFSMLIDPIFGYSNGTVMLVVVAFEACVAGICVAGGSLKLQLASVAGLTGGFLAYHGATAYYGIATPCKCLGTSVDWLPWVAAHEKTFLWSVLAVLSLSFFGLFRIHFQNNFKSNA